MKKVKCDLKDADDEANHPYCHSYAYKSTQVIDGSQVVCEASEGCKANAKLDWDNER